ncbi:MAG: hypothetical protein LBR31_09400 [Desulfovibrio sp.]|jgi:hypothetical protein|nr:hypothetical protein [Desulfovibrio sp.]
MFGAARLEKRIEKLEQATAKPFRYLWTEPTDGGLLHDGVFYSDEVALCNSLELDPEAVTLFRWA